MHHLIWIKRETLSGVTVAEQLAAVGLADHADGAQTVPCEGPDGGGTLFGWNALQGRLHYHVEQQTWLPAVADGERPAGRYWVGVWNDSPPTESDLRRPGTLYGDDVTLGDGQPWMVPAPAFLPHDMMLQDDGSIRMEPKRRYQDVCVEASRWRRKFRGDERQWIEYVDLWRFCLRCLALNYRLPPEIASHLRLIDTENVKAVVCAALAWEGE